jgi:guanylate kinase
MATISPGKLIVISGPSGAGKTTLVGRLFDRCKLPLVPAVSATTRKPRPGEINGRDYYFIDEATFEQRRLAGEFLECCEVFGSGHWYGTLRGEVTPSLASGKWVVLEIDVQGTLAVLEHYPDAITIFVRPRSLEELERRLRDRGTESEAAIQRRLEVARHEWMFAERYRHQVINDDVERSVQQLCDILTNGG